MERHSASNGVYVGSSPTWDIERIKTMTEETKKIVDLLYKYGGAVVHYNYTDNSSASGCTVAQIQKEAEEAFAELFKALTGRLPTAEEIDKAI